MEFPRFVYRSATSYTLVNDETEFDAAMKSGWFASVPECEQANYITGDTTMTDPEQQLEDDSTEDELDPEIAEPTREELEAKAKELGISFNGNTKDETLLKKIEEALNPES